MKNNLVLLELFEKQKEINENFDKRLKNLENTILPAIPEGSKKLNECKKIIKKTYKEFNNSNKLFNYYYKKLNQIIINNNKKQIENGEEDNKKHIEENN